ncbi:MAG: diacylglycerol kinase family protein [Myxococcota bacterium]
MILNPASAAGATGRRQGALIAEIEACLGSVEVECTKQPGDGTRIAHAAALRGVERILVGGGDGTLNEVVTGLMEAADRERLELPRVGLLPLGSGWDFARSLGLPRDLAGALSLVQRGKTRAVDLGRVTFTDTGGAARSRYFANEASAGLSGVTVQRVGDLSKRVGPRIGFILGAVGAILSHRPLDASVEIDGLSVHEGALSMIVAANGCYFGAGMKVAPSASVDDGKLEVVVVRGLSLPRLLLNLPRLALGRHAGHPSVSFHSARSVSVMPKEIGAPIDLDGESVGTLPMYAEILPKALRVFAEDGEQF